MAPQSCICVFVKPPCVGAVKTRLVPAVGAEGAARLAQAFFRDTWTTVRAIPAHRVAAVAAGGTKLSAFRRSFGPGADEEVRSQGGGDLGARMERVLRAALRRFPQALAIGTDSPGMPIRLLRAGRRELDRVDAVVGPAEDGGFYLLGLRRCPPGLLRGIPWSRPDTAPRTIARLRAFGLTVELLTPWFDVDRPADLERLRSLITRGAIKAPETERALAELAGVATTPPPAAAEAALCA